MLEIKNLSISIEDRLIVKDLSFTLHRGDKLAIIGEEGNGKSTLLKSILNECDYANIKGQVIFKNNKIAHLKQTMEYETLELTVYDYLFINEEDYYAKVDSLYRHLKSLNIDDDLFNHTMRSLSGGERIKIEILKILLDDADIYFLDEPTNDLDIETLKWLETFILETPKPVIYVSHDETLLSKTANMILHLEQLDDKKICRHTLLKTDYDTYIQNRLRAIDKQRQVATNERRDFKKKEDKLRQLKQKVEYRQNTISRSDPFGAKILKKKMHTLISQEKKLASTQLTELPEIEEEINFFFEPVFIPAHKTIISLELEKLTIDNKVLAQNIKLELIGNAHICIIGKNGIGKSTLLKYIYRYLQKQKNIKVGYMPQDYDEILKNYDRVLDFISEGRDKEEITKARTQLRSMNLTREEIMGKTNDLSNGTKAKLFLAKMLLDRCEVLILDEPTRNLSPLSNPVLRKALKNYKGAIISVSHDRKYIESVADIVYILTENGIKEIDK